jgi:stage IV sporulation protein FB
MRWSLTVGRFGGTAVKIHITFLLFLAWIGFSAWREHGATAARDSSVFIVLLFLCVVLHEFGHILMARRFGIQTPEVTLLPIRGVASLQRPPTKPREEFLVAIAGPLVNVVIGLALILWLGGVDASQLDRLDDPNLSWLERLAVANIFLAVFNLIPAFPMDGGRVLHALLSSKVGNAKATEIAASIGQAIAFGFGFLGLFGNPMLMFIAIFIYVAAAAEAQMSAMHEALRGLSAGDAMETRFTAIPIEASLAQAVEALMSTAQHEFPVVDAASKPLGLIAREDILTALAKHDGATPVAPLLGAPIETLSVHTPADAALDKLQDKTRALCVTNSDGVIVGLITRHALAEVMMIKSARPDWSFHREA